jgi:hypothetical protein
MITLFGFHNIFSLILSDFGSLAGFGSLEGITSLVLASVGVSIVMSPSAPVFRALTFSWTPWASPKVVFQIELSSCPPNEPRACRLIRSRELSTASPWAVMIKMVTGSLLKQLESYILHKNMFIPQARLNRA